MREKFRKTDQFTYVYLHTIAVHNATVSALLT